MVTIFNVLKRKTTFISLGSRRGEPIGAISPWHPFLQRDLRGGNGRMHYAFVHDESAGKVKLQYFNGDVFCNSIGLDIESIRKLGVMQVGGEQWAPKTGVDDFGSGPTGGWTVCGSLLSKKGCTGPLSLGVPRTPDVEAVWERGLDKLETDNLGSMKLFDENCIISLEKIVKYSDKCVQELLGVEELRTYLATNCLSACLRKPLELALDDFNIRDVGSSEMGYSIRRGSITTGWSYWWYEDAAHGTEIEWDIDKRGIDFKDHLHVAHIDGFLNLHRQCASKKSAIFKWMSKTAFLNGELKEDSLCLQVSQNLRGIFINQSKFVLEVLKKFGMDSCDPIDTPWWIELNWASPTKTHLEALKRVFRYLKGTINWGLWYPKDTAMALTAYADADHAGCQDTRRSTSGSAQFLGDKLVSWSSKKQKSTTISTIKAEYIAMSRCCAQILWIYHSLQTTALSSIRFLCIVTIVVPLLSVAIMSNTPGPSTLTYDTIL
ncbi:hypothetical protein Tco_0862969 [Tanacetum coccineum]